MLQPCNNPTTYPYLCSTAGGEDQCTFDRISKVIIFIPPQVGVYVTNHDLISYCVVSAYRAAAEHPPHSLMAVQ